MNGESSPSPDQHPNPQSSEPGATPKPPTPPMPAVKVTWKTSLSDAKAMAAKLDADFAAQFEPLQDPAKVGHAHADAAHAEAGQSADRPNTLSQLAQKWKSAQAEYGEYHPMAYQFVREGVRHTVEMIHGLREQQERESGTLQSMQPEKHVSAQQLCYGLKDLAMDRYGGLARTVLMHWGIRSTRDVGNIVFSMLSVGILGRSESDSLEQFEGVFDFAEELAAPF